MQNITDHKAEMPFKGHVDEISQGKTFEAELTLNLHLVTTTNFKVWSFPKISSLHKMSSCGQNRKLVNFDLRVFEQSFSTEHRKEVAAAAVTAQ